VKNKNTKIQKNYNLIYKVHYRLIKQFDFLQTIFICLITFTLFIINYQSIFAQSAFSQNTFSQDAPITNFSFVTPKNIEALNTNSDDFAPSYNKFENLLYFNRLIKAKSILFISNVVKNDTISFSNISELNSEINRTNLSPSFITFENDKKAIFSKFTKSNGINYLNLYYSVFQKNTWTYGNVINEFKDDCFVSHPTISPNKDYIIFVKEVKTNKNGENKFDFDQLNKNLDTDLMMSYKDQEGNWTEPYSIDELNTQGSEITPFIKGNNGNDTLFFASNGFGGVGGYDLFYSVKVDGKWNRPNPIIDLNTEFDESDITFINENVIFASNRPGGKGGLDLYQSKLNVVQKNQIKSTNIELSLDVFIDLVNIKRDYKYQNNFLKRFLILNEKEFNTNKNIELNYNDYQKIKLISESSGIDNSNESVENIKINENNVIIQDDFLSSANLIKFFSSQNVNTFDNINNIFKNKIVDNNLLNFYSIISPINKLYQSRSNINNLTVYITVISNYENKELTSNNNLFINDFINNVKKTLLLTEYLNSENIQINYITNNNLDKENAIIYFDYSDYLLFESPEEILGKDSIYMEPNILGLSFNARPINEISSWKCYVKNLDNQVIINSNQIPLDFQFNLDENKTKIKNLDSLNLVVEVKNKSNNSFYDYNKITLLHTNFRTLNYYNITENNLKSNKNKKYELRKLNLSFVDNLLLKKDIQLNNLLINLSSENKELILIHSENGKFNKSNLKNMEYYFTSQYPNLKYKIISNTEMANKLKIKDLNGNEINSKDFQKTVNNKGESSEFISNYLLFSEID